MLKSMKRRDGFTLIELLITVTIMVILLSLLVVNLRGSLANGRDEKRKTDVEVIARGLEQRYINGNPRATSPSIEKGAYPGTNEILHAQGQTVAGFNPPQIAGGYLTDLLPGTTRDNFIPPNNGTFIIICNPATTTCPAAETSSNVNTVTTSNVYVYEPIDRNGNICSDTGCVRFNLYYRSEVSNTVQTVKSKNQ